MKLDDMPDVQFIKALLKGKPGVTKTSSGLSFPQPMLVFDFDRKLVGPRRYLRSKGVDTSKIDVQTQDDWKTWMNFEQMLRSYRKNPGIYKSFGFDSYTTIADHLLGYTSEEKYDEKKGDVKKVGGVQVAGIDEYNAETAGLMDILLFVKEVKAHVWMTAHVLESKSISLDSSGKSQTIITRAIATGGKKAAVKIPAYFPEVYAINTEAASVVVNANNMNYVAYTQTAGEDEARTEFGLPMKLDFTNKLFFDVVMNNIKR